MHSWVFRHRARLRVIFGVAGAVQEEPPRPEPPPAPRPVRRLKPTHRPQRAPRGAPGTLDRGARNVTLRPMGPPAE